MQTTSVRPWIGLSNHSQKIFTHGKRIWTAYSDQMRALEPSLKSIAMPYVDERNYKSITEPTINLIVPMLLANTFGVTDSTVIEKVTLANLSLDHFTHLLDDATDCPSSAAPHQLHLSHLLLSQATTGFLSLSTHAETFSHWFNRYLKEAMVGESELWKHHKTLTEYTEADYQSLARRGGLIRVSAAIYADITDRWHLLAPLEEALLDAAVGIQLIDDILDWQEDLNQSIYTQPLVAALRVVGLEKAMGDADAIPRAIMLAGVADDIIQCARDRFDNATYHFQRIKANDLAAVAVDLSNQVHKLQQVLAKQRASNTPLHGYRTSLQSTVDIRMQH